ncbi:TPA: MFS transporter, partial [Klebsiella quasipneumoniae subsp. similipneumoniae]|nr:MFS transporter [Klebsiella quasipneumoniae subsp. similipneumoniae]
MTDQLPNRATDNDALEKETMRRVIWRILPFLVVSYLVSIIDRGNIGMAALQMNEDLGLSKAAFGFASSLYFVAYFIFEVPSNLAMQKVGARLWIPRIMISWGVVSMCMALVQNTTSLYIVRFLLGAAEAGFFPGVVLYLTWWIPSRYRARIIASFMVAIPLANFIGSPLSGLILTLDGWLGLRGWHLLFIIEGLPAVLLGIAAFFILRDRPHQAGWLTERQKAWLENTLQAERQQQTQIGHTTTW